ncbi:MAG: proprotein convertase P-domain-containing protein [Xanthomonadaceae bacterium]|nr:proprotein convertase P-domain-containing protein [Xanthomonadaceae bacterium]
MNTFGCRTAAFSGATLRISYTAGGATAAPATFANEVDVSTRDNATVASAISVSGRPATLSNPLTIDAVIRHPAIRELRVELVGPDGLTVVLHDRAGRTAANLTGRWTLTAPGRAANGTWQLRVTDAVTGNGGVIDRWSLTF